MKKEHNIGIYNISRFQRDRIPTLDFLALGDNKHYVKGLIELDVTKGRSYIAKYEEEMGIKLSFTAWLLKCIAEAASEHKEVHSMMMGRKRIITFEDVDISITVERIIKGISVVIPLVIRKANEKTVRQIHEEIRAAQSEKVETATVLGESKMKKRVKFYISFPKSLRRFFIKRVLKNPLKAKQLMGTIIVTSVGMFGNLHGWPIPTTNHPLCFAVGRITKKPGVIDNNVEIRDILTMTILFNHDVVDGAPATRFVSHLGQLVERGFALEQ